MKKQHHNYQLPLITTTNHYQLITITDKYATTRLCYKLLDGKYLDKNGKVKRDLKFKLSFPEFGIVDSKIPAKEGEKFDTYLFLPEGKGRKGEGGLRTKGYFKFNYKLRILNYELKEKHEIQNPTSKIQNFLGDWYIIDEDDNPIEKVELPENILQQLTNYKLTTTNSKLTTNDHKYTQLPLITIITVVYNGEKYLEETIQSVINQTYPNVEYIIIDGGSTDGTLDIIKKYEDYIDYWVSERDKGIFNAMNKGIKLSRGRIVGLINSDDWYELRTLEKIANVYNLEETNIDIIHGDMIYYKEKKALFKISPSSIETIKKEMIFNHPTCFVNISWYKKMGLFDERYKIASDYELLLRAFKHKARFFYVSDVLANMRYEGESDINVIKALKEARDISIKYGYPKFLANIVYFKKVAFNFVKSFVGKDSTIAQIYRKLSKRKEVFCRD